MVYVFVVPPGRDAILGGQRAKEMGHNLLNV